MALRRADGCASGAVLTDPAKVNQRFACAFDRVFLALQDRYERRKKEHKRAETAFIAASRRGAVTPKIRASYAAASARYDEARLMLNRAKLEWSRARREAFAQSLALPQAGV